jgi:hypothetical protein
VPPLWLAPVRFPDSPDTASLNVSTTSPATSLRPSEVSPLSCAALFKRAGDYASQVKDDLADTVSDYASQMKDRISDTASSYADTVKDFADDARRAVTERRYEAQIVLRDMKHCAFRFRIGQLVRYGARFFSALVPMLWTAENGFHGPMPQ